jgi:hypothetical protein
LFPILLDPFTDFARVVPSPPGEFDEEFVDGGEGERLATDGDGEASEVAGEDESVMVEGGTEGIGGGFGRGDKTLFRLLIVNGVTNRSIETGGRGFHSVRRGRR